VNLPAKRIDFNPPGRVQTAKRRPIVPISDNLLPILLFAQSRARTQWVLDTPGSVRTAFEGACGDGTLDPVCEECDDGNNFPGDGCSSNCEIEPWRKIMTGVMMVVAGGERVEDVEVLRKDAGLLESLGWEEINCADTQLNFTKDRRNNARNRRVNDRMVIKAMKLVGEKELTYDNDATYIDSEKDSAAYSYQKRKQFSGLLGYIPELELINTVDYRPGNKSPQTGIINQLRKACRQAKKAGKRIARFRSDSAAHQDRIFTYCDTEDIEYYISLDKNEIIRRMVTGIEEIDWKTMHGKYKDQHNTQWAESEYVVSKGYRIRALILRWKNPDPTLFDESPYCYHVVGTNNWDIDPMQWLEVHNGRMGTIEQCNKELKNGFGCDYTPSHNFEKNRGFFLLGVLAYNMTREIT